MKLHMFVGFLLASDGGYIVTSTNRSDLVMRQPSPDYWVVRVHCDNAALPRLESRGTERWIICDARQDGGSP